MKNTKQWFPYLLVIPAFLVAMLTVAYPIVNGVAQSFEGEDGGFTLSNYVYFFTDRNELANIGFTLVICLVTVVLAVVSAYLLALYLRFTHSWFSRAIGFLYLLPRFVPSMVAVYAMIAVVRDSGFINRLMLLFGINAKPGLMYSANGVVLMNLWFNIPFAAMIIAASLGGVRDSIIESARDVGAGRWTIFRTIILPLTYKDALVASTFVFMTNVGSFTTPYLMGPNAPKLLGVDLFNQFNSYGDYPKAAALSTIMFLLCAASAVVYIYTNMKDSEWEKK
ncbi:ABC transporter permease [Bifidobacterium samirii]|uniref:ABC transporter permease protein n=1 Tax=Bifidobacterium samirii TaxID=2306974 RepID=A0A430FW98_9BIFI|nr:ABC transporter permease [Bifidobacterium samirii]RSX58387.1 aBC transporter permease protein [Bifidobacterium samirii]